MTIRCVVCDKPIEQVFGQPPRCPGCLDTCTVCGGIGVCQEWCDDDLVPDPPDVAEQFRKMGLEAN